MSRVASSDHPAFQSVGTRPHDAAKLPPGIRVRYDYWKWTRTVRGYEKDPQWATQEWAFTRFGVTAKDAKFGIFPANHPWGVPSWATAVHFDGEQRTTWIHTVCLDAIGWQERKTDQPELELALC